MVREFFAHYAFALQDEYVQGAAIDYLACQAKQAPGRWPGLADLSDDWARLLVLSQAIATGHREFARMGTRRAPGGYRFWLEQHAERFLQQQRRYLEHLGLLPVLPDLKALPPGSWAVQFTFTLAKPYLSQDDTEFYILDNPVRKEWVFKVPYVAPSQWKGALRAAMRRRRGYTTWEEESQDAQMMRLFGNIKGEEENFSVGRLFFYPTFFDRIGLEVINPHPRDTGAGRQPIYFECVPAGARGTFTLLYVPLDGGPVDEAIIQADLQAVVEGLRAMFTEYGFGAKTSSGYGVA
ncbi:MAG: hypothetical protein RMK65_04015, partial [Anaerolineae bacterium]|nr:hypothetical protein [Anaerolineae bacterium]MDW7991305.1 hypothetical protein [Anaerolineae bacterium]